MKNLKMAMLLKSPSQRVCLSPPINLENWNESSSGWNPGWTSSFKIIEIKSWWLEIPNDAKFQIQISACVKAIYMFIIIITIYFKNVHFVHAQLRSECQTFFPIWGFSTYPWTFILTYGLHNILPCMKAHQTWSKTWKELTLWCLCYAVCTLETGTDGIEIDQNNIWRPIHISKYTCKNMCNLTTLHWKSDAILFQSLKAKASWP